jgi:RNA polymerase sigma-70 factor (ECF subfamily)
MVNHYQSSPDPGDLLDAIFRDILIVLGDRLEKHGDVLQQALIELLERYLLKGAEVTNWWALFWRIASHRRTDHRRKEARYRPWPGDWDVASRGDDPADTAEWSDLKRRLRQAITELPDPLRSVAVLRYQAGLPYEDIAQGLRIPVGTVRSRLSNAAAKLRIMLVNGFNGRGAVNDQITGEPRATLVVRPELAESGPCPRANPPAD